MARLRTLLLVVLLAGALASPGIAHAAPKAAASRGATSTAPVVEAPIDAQVWPAQDGQSTTVVLAVQLDSTTKLPARVRVPVPIGSTVQWAGEIVGNDPNNDIERPFTLHDGAGGAQYAEFTLESSRRGQVEAGGIAMTSKSDVLSTEVDYVQSAPAPSTVFTVRLPAGASQVKIEPTPQGAPEANTSGETLYVLPTQKLATGEKLTIKASYSTTPRLAGGASGSNFTSAYLVLGILLVVAVAVVVYLATRRRVPDAAGGADEAFDEDEPQDDEAEFDEDEEPDDTDLEWGEASEEEPADSSGAHARSNEEDDPFSTDDD
jgi:hypothetical protein